MFCSSHGVLVAENVKQLACIGHFRWSLAVVEVLSRVEWVGELRVAAHTVVDHVLEVHLGVVGEATVHVDRPSLAVACKYAVRSLLDSHFHEVVEFGFPAIVPVAHVLGDLSL